MKTLKTDQGFLVEVTKVVYAFVQYQFERGAFSTIVTDNEGWQHLVLAKDNI
jgi:hypothetical protein